MDKIKKVNELIASHEEKISNKLLEFLASEKKIKVLGKLRVQNKNRAPTISFTVDGILSKNVSEELVRQRIALRNDNFYAWRCLRAFGIDTKDGVVRASMVHYNNLDEVDNLIKALKESSILKN